MSLHSKFNAERNFNESWFGKPESKVQKIVELVAKAVSYDEIIYDHYSELCEDDIKRCIDYAKDYSKTVAIQTSENYAWDQITEEFIDKRTLIRTPDSNYSIKV
jgi:hypothetical protein